MAKYDGQLTEVKNRLPNAKSILIAIPSDANLDGMASGAALFLALQSHGKEVQIVSDKLPQVVQANLYGVGSIKNTIISPSGSVVTSIPGGDYTLVLEGVATPQNTVPSLKNLDWYAENNNLNLVFHVLPGQSFQPTNVHPRGAPGGGENFDLIFTIGVPSFTNLGNIYNQNMQAFSGTHIINIDNDSMNSNFGQTNVLDSNVSSVSEILVDVIPSLGLPFDRDIATNLLAGIFDMTGNLTNEKVGPETYVAVGNCVKVGGQKPIGTPTTQTTSVSGFQTPASSQQEQPMMDFSAFMRPPAQSQPIPSQPISGPTPILPEIPPVIPVSQVLPNEVGSQPTQQPQTYQPSPEEHPAGERVVTDSPEPGWLTPKVFKGTSVG